MFGLFEIPKPVNEPIFNYSKGTPEASELKAKIAELKSGEIEIPLLINGKEVHTGNFGYASSPHNHGHRLARFHKAGEKEINAAISAAMNAKKVWDKFSYSERASIFMRAAEMLSTSWRSTINAATMLCQSKNVYQAEIDAVCESVDFFNFNAYNMSQIYKNQLSSDKGVWNYTEYRPLDGFVFAVTPFNFTAIASNLISAPAVMGNTIVWKPAVTAIYSSYFIMKLLQKAGLPDGVLNMIPGQGSLIGPMVMKNENMAGIHFTGSTGVFDEMWKTVGDNISSYRCYPRLVGETGGKDFIFAHPSAELDSLCTALIRGAFEYQGQKCSAASRAYIAESVWKKLEDKLVSEVKKIKMGDVEDFSVFMGAVIDKSSFDNIKSYIDYAKNSKDAKIIAGGGCDSSKGYFVEPTLILTTDPKFKSMQEEIFGPVLTIYVYKDADFEKTLELCDQTSPYALTGAIFAEDRTAVKTAFDTLRYSAGNFYINDKCTGAVVGQQPFGGARKSGTNDKAGSFLNLVRWTSARTVKENFCPPGDFKYGYMNTWE